MVDEMVRNWSSNGQETVKNGRKWPGNGLKWSPNGHEMDHFNTFVVRPENVVAKEGNGRAESTRSSCPCPTFLILYIGYHFGQIRR